MPCTLRHAQDSVTPSPYPCKWLYPYGGDKFLKPKANKKIHRRKGTTYYYFTLYRDSRHRVFHDTGIHAIVYFTISGFTPSCISRYRDSRHRVIHDGVNPDIGIPDIVYYTIS